MKKLELDAVYELFKLNITDIYLDFIRTTKETGDIIDYIWLEYPVTSILETTDGLFYVECSYDVDEQGYKIINGKSDKRYKIKPKQHPKSYIIKI